MTDKAKAQYRAKIYQLIETLKNNIMLLKVETSAPSKYDDDEYGGIQYGPDDEEYQEWEWKYRLDPNDQRTIEYMKAVAELEESLYSKEGARYLPRGLYRALIEFGDKCLSCKKWVNWKSMHVGYSVNTGEPSAERLLATSMAAIGREQFQSTIKQMIREIYFFENERDESEESFFGTAG